MFTVNYLIFDEFGIERVLCMACAKVIKTRKEIVSKSGAPIRELSKHNDYKEIPVILNKGQLAFIMVCDDCKFSEISKEDARNISHQLQEALKLQLEHEGKLPDVIETIVKEQNFNVVRKAEVSEVTAALRGV